MRFIHANNKVVKLCQYIGKGGTQRFLKLMEIELRVRLAVEDFPDVENEKLNIRSLFNNQSHLVILYGISIIILTIVNLRSAHF